MTLSSQLSQDELLEMLRRREIPHNEIAGAIVRIAKPFDAKRIENAAALIAEFIDDPNATVRHEALWFLGSWGKLAEFTPTLLRVLQEDVDIWNRAYAARCLGLLSTQPDKEVTRILLQVALNEKEEDEVRSSAYGALKVRETGGQSSSTADDFQIWQSKTVADFDYGWLKSISLS